MYFVVHYMKQKGGEAVKTTSKEQIQAAFRGLLFAKSLDKITVRDIVEACGLTRNTFYNYYEDIYDLFDDYLDMQTHAVYRTLTPQTPWNEVVLTLVCSIFDSPQTGRHILYSKKSDTMRRYLNQLLTLVIDRYITQQTHALSLSAEDRRLICDTLTHALYGLLEQWITGPDASQLRVLLRRVLSCFEGSVLSALRYCAANPRSKEEFL